MSAIVIIDGTAAPENREKIRRYAFLCGIMTCSLEKLLGRGPERVSLMH